MYIGGLLQSEARGGRSGPPPAARSAELRPQVPERRTDVALRNSLAGQTRPRRAHRLGGDRAGRRRVVDGDDRKLARPCPLRVADADVDRVAVPAAAGDDLAGRGTRPST